MASQIGKRRTTHPEAAQRPIRATIPASQTSAAAIGRNTYGPKNRWVDRYRVRSR